MLDYEEAVDKLTREQEEYACEFCGTLTYYRLPNGGHICTIYCLGQMLKEGWLDDDLRITDRYRRFLSRLWDLDDTESQGNAEQYISTPDGAD